MPAWLAAFEYALIQLLKGILEVVRAFFPKFPGLPPNTFLWVHLFLVMMWGALSAGAGESDVIAGFIPVLTAQVSSITEILVLVGTLIFAVIGSPIIHFAFKNVMKIKFLGASHTP